MPVNNSYTQNRGLNAGLLLLSFILLAYEVAQLRIFAHCLNPILVVSAISITMLGFGAASTFLSLWPRLISRPPRPLLALLCTGFALSGLLANLVFAEQSARLAYAGEVARTYSPRTILVILLCALPYAFGGLAVALILSRCARHSGKTYFYNLLGSGLGCYAVSFGLRPLGAERFVLLLLALAAALGAIWAGNRSRRLLGGNSAIALALIMLLPRAPDVLQFNPDPYDQLGIMAADYRLLKGREPVREFSAWDPVARVEVHSWRGQFARVPAPIPFKILSHDGGAATALLALPQDPFRGARLFGGGVYGASFELRPRADVLVIGVGGAMDIQSALYYGARRITAVEINESTVEAVSGKFGEFLGRPYQQPQVETVRADGRAFVRRTGQRFDVIQLSGTDTLTPRSSSSLVMAEDYLYTVEAFADYLNALKEDGIVSVIRFGVEHYRLAAIAAAALRRLGIENADKHIVVLGQAVAKLAMIKRSAWTPAELKLLDARIARGKKINPGIAFPAYDVFNIKLGAPLTWVYAPGKPWSASVYSQLFGSTQGRHGSLAYWLPTDDRPNFFISDWIDYLYQNGKVTPVTAMIGMYMRFCVLLVAIALLATVLPAAALARGALRTGASAATFAYFFVLGFCYMLLEIGIMQKAVIVVEHPSYSIAVTLAALLISSALGSRLSESSGWSERRVVIGAAAGIGILGGGYALGLDSLFRALMPVPFALRMAVVALAIAPLGFCMGTLMPTGLRRLERRAGRLVPWAIAINSFASVIGSVVSLPFAIRFGFTLLFALGAAAYLLVIPAFLRLSSGSHAELLDSRADATSENKECVKLQELI